MPAPARAATTTAPSRASRPGEPASSSSPTAAVVARPPDTPPLVVLPLMTAPLPEPAAYAEAAEAPDHSPAASDTGGLTVRETHTIYSAADRDVVPPELVRPQVPSGPRIDTEPSDAEIELVVNAEGIVTQVRLRTDGELSLNDRMIVAAAKAWVFRPALKDGRPVSYTLRIPVAP